MEPSRAKLVRINTLTGSYKGKWQEMRSSPPIPLRRCYHSASIHNESLLIYGGQDFSEGVYSDLWQFRVNSSDPSQEKWERVQTTGQAPGSLCRHSSITHGSGLYVFGGNDGNADNSFVFILELQSRVWRRLESGILAVDSYSSVVFLNKWVIFGGYAGGNLINEAFEFDLNSETWSGFECTGEKPCPRADHTAVLKDGFMWVYGGKGTEGHLQDLWRLDLNLRTWQEVRYLGNGPGTVSGHSALAYGDVMLVFGGYRDILKETNEMYTYDFFNNNWVLIQNEMQVSDPVSSSEVQQYNKKMKKLENNESGKVVLYGGPPSQMQGRINGKFPHSRDGHSAVLYEDMMIVFGGDRHQMAFNDLYCYSIHET